MSYKDEWVDICSKEDLVPNSGICALVTGEQVAIFYFPDNDTLYAINNFDPFGKVHVLSRGMVGDLNGVPMVSSPLYKQHFNLKTGQCLEDEDVSVESYGVRIKDDRVEVNLTGE
jgi:NAD(P)H-dependent nitrite reductase small subunit